MINEYLCNISHDTTKFCTTNLIAEELTNTITSLRLGEIPCLLDRTIFDGNLNYIYYTELHVNKCTILKKYGVRDMKICTLERIRNALHLELPTFFWLTSS